MLNRRKEITEFLGKLNKRVEEQVVPSLRGDIKRVLLLNLSSQIVETTMVTCLDALEQQKKEVVCDH
jgi:hypothetical protein